MFKKLNRVIEVMKKTQIKLLEMKSTLVRVNGRLGIAEEKVSKLKRHNSRNYH